MRRTVVLYGLLDAAPSPRAPDPYVFGDPVLPLPAAELRGFMPVRCEKHQAGWDGDGACWCCAAGVAG